MKGRDYGKYSNNNSLSTVSICSSVIYEGGLMSRESKWLTLLVAVLLLAIPILGALTLQVSGMEEVSETCLGLEGVELTSLLHQADEALKAENDWESMILMRLIFTATGGIGEQRGMFLYEDHPVMIVDTPSGFHTIVTYIDSQPDTNDVEAIECFILVEELPEPLIPYDFSEST